VSEPIGPYEIRQGLIRGLVYGHAGLYRNSPTFHAQIEMLANMLPLMVNGIADSAKVSDHVYAQHAALQRVELHPLCLCGHSKSEHFEGDKPGCLSCEAPHSFEPRWVLAQCEARVPEHVARKTGFPVHAHSCLREKGHNPYAEGHIAVHGEQWVSWV
jgi:hypothetical protein